MAVVDTLYLCSLQLYFNNNYSKQLQYLSIIIRVHTASLTHHNAVATT